MTKTFNFNDFVYNNNGVVIAIGNADQQSRLLTCFPKNLGIRKIIWLPKFPRTSSWFGLGLRDFMCFVGNDVLLLCDAQTDVDERYLKECESILKKNHCFKQTNKKVLEIVAKILGKTIPNDCDAIPKIKLDILPTGVRKGQSAKSRFGMYAGIIETDRALFVPQYGIMEDKLALVCFRTYTTKPVFGINCTDMMKHGLSLRDMTCDC